MRRYVPEKTFEKSFRKADGRDRLIPLTMMSPGKWRVALTEERKREILPVQVHPAARGLSSDDDR
jgi:hypothetical protein